MAALRVSWNKSMDGVLLSLLVMSLGINVFLAMSRARSNSAIPSRRIQLKAGSTAPAFEGSELHGAKFRLMYGSTQHETLLYVFSPTCHWCQRNAANIRAITAARPDIQIIGVNIGPDMSAADAPNEPFTKIVRPTPSTIAAFHLSATPTTFLLSPDGTVVRVWSGAYTGPVANDVSQVLAINLPGLLAE